MKRSKLTNFFFYILFLSLAPSELAIGPDAELLLQSQIDPLVPIFLLSVLDYSVHVYMPQCKVASYTILHSASHLTHNLTVNFSNNYMNNLGCYFIELDTATYTCTAKELRVMNMQVAVCML